MPGPRKSPTKADTVLARLRIERGISQEEVAVLARIPLRTYRSIESGAQPNPRLSQLVAIAVVLGLDPKKHLTRVINDVSWERLGREAQPAVADKKRFKR